MKVCEIGNTFGIENMLVANRPRPSPGHGQAVIRVRSVSVNYRDLLMVKGLYNPGLALPIIPFSDGAGEVVDIKAYLSVHTRCLSQ